MNKIKRYVIIGSVCVATIAALLVYQNMDSKTQTPIQNTPNSTKSEQVVQTVQTVQPSNTTQASSTTQTTINTALLEQDIHEIANQARQSNGVRPISYDLKLADIARTHSQDMAIHQFLSQYSYVGGHDLNYRYAFAGYNCQVQVGAYVYSTSNENIAVVTAQGSELQIAQHIVNNWLNSMADRDNIYDTEHKTEGIGVALTENKMAVYATEDFC